MKRMTGIVLCCLAIFITGCKSPAFILMNEYKDKELSSKHLAVAIGDPVILNKDDVIDDLGSGVAEDVFAKHFEKSFADRIRRYARVDSISFMRTKAMNSFSPRELMMNEKEKIRISLPTDGQIVFEGESNKPEFILFLGQFVISRIAGSSGTAGTWTPGAPGAAPKYTPGSGGSFGALSHQVEFALWDNTSGRLVSWGRYNSQSSIVFTMTKDNWDKCLENLAREIMRASPFYEWGRKVTYSAG